MDYVIFSSYGNDSIALIQWAYEHRLGNVVVSYTDTGWAADWWGARVEQAESWVTGSLGFQCNRVISEGMASLVTRKKAWPRGGGGKFQFCTQELKIKPALEWLDKADPCKDTVCMVGIRREESPNRSQFPEWTESSIIHGGRSLYAPLVNHDESDRNLLLSRTPFQPLPHRSKECSPCVNARKGEIAALTDAKIKLIDSMERTMGINSKGNPRVMFSPSRSKGAIGITKVVEWARGCQQPEEIVDSKCDGGWCGS